MSKLKVAFQGIKGSYSDEAVSEIFGDEAEKISCRNFDELSQALEQQGADYILAPIKNSLIGDIAGANELLSGGKFRVHETYQKRIQHSLIGCDKANVKNIETVASQYAALAQCRKFFQENSQIKEIITADTASAARDVIAAGDSRRAAIASKHCVKLYGGRILLEHIQDAPENYTTFYLLTR